MTEAERFGFDVSPDAEDVISTIATTGTGTTSNLGRQRDDDAGCTEYTRAGLVYRRRFDDGTDEHYDEQGRLHRESGPAVSYPDGTQEWYVHGVLDHKHLAVQRKDDF